MTRKKKKESERRTECSAWCRLIKILSHQRPPEIDEDLAKVRKQIAEAQKITDYARATLDGEDHWFLENGNRKERD